MEQQQPRTDDVLFVMTIDTEEEWDWDAGFPFGQKPAVQNTQKIPKFQAFCHDLGVKPTYFIDYAIASDPESVKRFRPYAEAGECEIGGHLHAWVTPPVEEQARPNNTHAINLPPDLVRRKLNVLTHKLKSEFGMQPTSFRSGRWGINGQMLRQLADEGYELDSSIFPFYTDTDPEPNFSYAQAPDRPYWPDFTDCLQAGEQRRIFELPVSSGFNHPNFEACHAIHRTLSASPWNRLRSIGILWHLRLLRKLQLSPELADAANMKMLVNSCLQRGHRVIHMFLHSSTLLPGGSPYVSNEHDEAVFYQNMADVITYVTSRANVTFCTLTEAKHRILQEDAA